MPSSWGSTSSRSSSRSSAADRTAGSVSTGSGAPVSWGGVPGSIPSAIRLLRPGRALLRAAEVRRSRRFGHGVGFVVDERSPVVGAVQGHGRGVADVLADTRGRRFPGVLPVELLLLLRARVVLHGSVLPTDDPGKRPIRARVRG